MLRCKSFNFVKLLKGIFLFWILQLILSIIFPKQASEDWRAKFQLQAFSGRGYKWDVPLFRLICVSLNPNARNWAMRFCDWSIFTCSNLSPFVRLSMKLNSFNSLEWRLYYLTSGSPSFFIIFCFLWKLIIFQVLFFFGGTSFLTSHLLEKKNI